MLKVRQKLVREHIHHEGGEGFAPRKTLGEASCLAGVGLDVRDNAHSSSLSCNGLRGSARGARLPLKVSVSQKTEEGSTLWKNIWRRGRGGRTHRTIDYFRYLGARTLPRPYNGRARRRHCDSSPAFFARLYKGCPWPCCTGRDTGIKQTRPRYH